MRIHGLLSWYDERPAWLAATVASVAPFCDHLVALDGAYALYPGGRATSEHAQAETIRETARACGMGVTIVEPRTRWMRNEVEKRAAMFRVAEALAEPEDDWYFVIDGDEVVTDVGLDLKHALSHTTLDCGHVTFWERDPVPLNGVVVAHSEQQIRVAFRAIPGLTVERRHYCYVTPDRRMLWGDGPCETPLDLSDVRIEHRTKHRDNWRRAAAKGYYDRRDELNIEGLIP